MTEKRFVCATTTTRPKQALTTQQLVGVLFVATVGGAYGVEGCVREGGGWWTVVGVGLTPWVWGLPTAVVVAELAAAVGSNAGAVMWVNLCCPEWVTLVFVIVTGIANFVDNSLYPNLLASYVLPEHPILLKVGTLFAATVVNVLGIDIVAHFGVVFTVLTTLPFLLITISSLPHVSFSNFYHHVPSTGVSWSRFLPLLSWNISGFDSAGHIVEETQTPGSTLFTSFTYLICLTELVYILPVLAVTATGDHPPDSWTTGYWNTVGDAHGVWVGSVVKLGGVVSCFGFMTAVLCTTSRAIQGMAVLGVFPESVSAPLGQVHPVYRTPVNAIIFNAFVTCVLSVSMEFSLLIDVGQMLYSVRLLFIFYAVVYLRSVYPTLRRPFKIPLGTPGLFLATVPPTLYCFLLLFFAISDSPESAAIFGLLSALIAATSLTVRCCCSTKAFEGRIADVADEVEDEPHTTTLSISPIEPGDSSTRCQIRGRSSNPTAQTV